MNFLNDKSFLRAAGGASTLSLLGMFHSAPAAAQGDAQLEHAARQGPEVELRRGARQRARHDEDGTLGGELLPRDRDLHAVAAELLGLDMETDIALLRIAERGLPALSLADSDRVEQGQIVGEGTTSAGQRVYLATPK